MTIPALPPVRDEDPPVPANVPSWWRRNLVALIALAVLLPATAATIGWQEWYQYFGFGARASAAVEVTDGDTAELAGATWGPIRGGEITDVSGLDVPDGTRLIAAGIPVDASIEGIGCDSPTLVEASTGREWRPVRSEIGLQYDPDEPERCLSEDAGEYELIVPFVVPDDAEGPFWVDVMPYDAGGSFVRFSFEP